MFCCAVASGLGARSRGLPWPGMSIGRGIYWQWNNARHVHLITLKRKWLKRLPGCPADRLSGSFTALLDPSPVAA